MTMESERTAVVYVANENKELTVRLGSTQATVEDLCVKVCRQLGIGPVARHLFALRNHSSKLWYPLGHLLTPKDKKFDFRLRFKPSTIHRLKSADENAYNYYFQQARSDVMENKVPDIVYEKHKQELIGLGVSDMYRVMLEKKLPRETVESEYRKYIPKECIKRHAFFIKKPIHNALRKISGYDANYVKEQYLKQFESMAPNYPYEEYEALMHRDLQNAPTKITIRVNRLEVSYTVPQSSNAPPTWTTLCLIEDLCFLSIRQDNTIEISRKTGIPSYLKFSKSTHLNSFVSALDGYYRLTSKWTFNLCGELVTPSLVYLHRIKCHGPVSQEFSYSKLRSKRGDKPGVFILRQSDMGYDDYYIDGVDRCGRLFSVKVEERGNEYWVEEREEDRRDEKSRDDVRREEVQGRREENARGEEDRRERERREYTARKEGTRGEDRREEEEMLGRKEEKIQERREEEIQRREGREVEIQGRGGGRDEEIQRRREEYNTRREEYNTRREEYNTRREERREYTARRDGGEGNTKLKKYENSFKNFNEWFTKEEDAKEEERRGENTKSKKYENEESFKNLNEYFMKQEKGTKSEGIEDAETEQKRREESEDAKKDEERREGGECTTRKEDTKKEENTKSKRYENSLKNFNEYFAKQEKNEDTKMEEEERREYTARKEDNKKEENTKSKRYENSFKNFNEWFMRQEKKEDTRKEDERREENTKLKGYENKESFARQQREEEEEGERREYPTTEKERKEENTKSKRYENSSKNFTESLAKEKKEEERREHAPTEKEHRATETERKEENKKLKRYEKKSYKTFNELFTKFELTECLPPSEYDKSNLLLCAEEDYMNEAVTADEEIVASILQTGPRCVPKDQLEMYKIFGETGELVCRKAVWRLAKGKKLEVVLKVLKQEDEKSLTKDFLALAGKWAQVRSESLVRLYGLVVTPVLGMLLEMVRYGPLDEYLRNCGGGVKTVDMVEATACLATALWHLEENGLVHGNIRCNKLLVHAHTLNSFVVKLSDPGIFVYKDTDIHWLPPESYSDPDSARASYQADVWAVATTIWQIFARGATLQEYKDAAVMKRYYESGKRLPNPTGCPVEVYRLMLECWGDGSCGSRKQPQAIMRDINQILYQVYNSRRSHSYATAFPKQFTSELKKPSHPQTQQPSLEDNSDSSDSRSLNSESRSGSSSLITETTSLQWNDTDDSTHGEITTENNWFGSTEELSAYLGLLSNGTRDADSSDVPETQLRLTHDLDEINEASGAGGDPAGNNNGSLGQMRGIYELDIDCNVILQGRIGQGFYGEVYRGTLERDGKDSEQQQVAVKKLKTKALEADIRDFEREIAIMKTLKHPNVVEILGVISEPEVCLVMEYVKHGSLQSYLTIHKQELSHKRLLSFALDIATGMDYLGSMNIVHRDLAARNILVADENKVKISDFGLAQVTGQNDYYILQTDRGLPIKWYAPESISYGKFSTRSDVWSFGVTMYETFAFGEEPQLPGLDSTACKGNRMQTNEEEIKKDNTELLAALERGTRLPCPSTCPQAIYVKLMYPCWHLESHRRPDFASLRRDISQLLAQY